MDPRSNRTRVEESGPRAAAGARKPYHAPRLESYGEMHRLTLGKGGNTPDVGGGASSKQLRGS